MEPLPRRRQPRRHQPERQREGGDHREGRLAAQRLSHAGSGGSEAHFRNLRIQELPSTNPKPEEITVEGAGYVPLFSGLDLRGWKVPAGDNGHWKVVKEVID
jgi:hypothetical protein